MPIIVYDTTLMRPACALLQAALGGDESIANNFPVEDWLLAPTADLKPYRINETELARLIKYHSEYHKL